MFELITVLFLLTPDGQSVRVEETRDIQGHAACQNALAAQRMEAGEGVGMFANCYLKADE